MNYTLVNYIFVNMNYILVNYVYWTYTIASYKFGLIEVFKLASNVFAYISIILFSKLYFGELLSFILLILFKFEATVSYCSEHLAETRIWVHILYVCVVHRLLLYVSHTHNILKL